jgi:hypothetical protein
MAAAASGSLRDEATGPPLDIEVISGLIEFCQEQALALEDAYRAQERKSDDSFNLHKKALINHYVQQMEVMLRFCNDQINSHKKTKFKSSYFTAVTQIRASYTDQYTIN